MSLNRALYEGACFKVGLLLGGTEVECWLFTAGCRLQFWKDHFRQWVIFEILHSITYKVSQKNIALALLVWPLHITLLCKIAHLSEMTILKIVSSSPLWVSPDYRNAIYQAGFETYTSHITLFNDMMVLMIKMTFLPQYCILGSDSWSNKEINTFVLDWYPK